MTTQNSDVTIKKWKGKASSLVLGLSCCLLILLQYHADYTYAIGPYFPNTYSLISELRNLKVATMFYYAAHGTLPYGDGNHIALIAQYTDYPDRVLESGRFLCVSTSNRLWVGYHLPNHLKKDLPYGTRKRLESRAQDRGLFGSASPETPPVSADLAYLYVADYDVVWMVAR
jgi:hypothetical protein